MHKTLRRQATVWLGLSIALGTGGVGLSEAVASRRADEGEPLRRITVWVYNYARVPDRTREQAEREIERILADAGVGTNWVECPVSMAEIAPDSACQKRMSPTELALVILPQFTSRGREQADSFLGSAQVFRNGQFGHYAYVFYDRVEDSGNRRGVSVSQFLAQVAVHELGHVLLRSSAHARSGLMRAQWGREELQLARQGNLLFPPAQAERLRAEVVIRAQVAEHLSAQAASVPQSK